MVRRVRPTPGSQLALDVVHDYHPMLTNRTDELVAVEADHRAHAVIELAIRDLKAGGLAHCPSGVFTANAAWLGLAVLAHNLGRWTLKAAGPAWERATVDTLRRKLVAMPAPPVRGLQRVPLGGAGRGGGRTRRLRGRDHHRHRGCRCLELGRSEIELRGLGEEATPRLVPGGVSGTPSLTVWSARVSAARYEGEVQRQNDEQIHASQRPPAGQVVL